MIDEAVILAGGLGTRLRGVVDDVPKPLAPVAGRPFLTWLLDALAGQRIRHIVLATGYLGEQVEAALGGRWQGMLLEYSREPRALGTGGAIALAARHVQGDTFFVLNGDTRLVLDYPDFDHHLAASGASLGVALANVPDTARYGAVQIENGRVTGFTEKGGTGAGYVNAGVYWLRRSLLADYSRAGAFSFEREVLVPMVQREPVMGYTQTSGFIDIGVPEDYRSAQSLFAAQAGGAA